jgi:hypothetical protein
MVDRKLWWTDQEFTLPISFHHGYPFIYITWGMNNRPEAQNLLGCTAVFLVECRPTFQR